VETGEALQEKKKGEKDDSSSRGHFFAICPHQTLYSYIGVYIDSFSEKREPGENPFFFCPVLLYQLVTMRDLAGPNDKGRKERGCEIRNPSFFAVSFASLRRNPLFSYTF
jgi:hypothetical protein